jgi:hypothetical protein
MAIISLFSGSFCQAEEIVRGVAERTGYAHIFDDEIVRTASEASGVASDKLARPLSAKASVFNSFTGERERSTAILRCAVAQRLLEEGLIVDGFCKQVFKELPMEFAVEAKALLEVSLEGAVG